MFCLKNYHACTVGIYHHTEATPVFIDTVYRNRCKGDTPIIFKIDTFKESVLISFTHDNYKRTHIMSKERQAKPT